MLDTPDINDLRSRILRGEDVSAEELAAAIVSLRGSRKSAAEAAAAKPKASRRAAAQSAVDSDALLDSL